MKIGVIVDNDFNSDTRVKNEIALLEKHNISFKILCFYFENTTTDNYEDQIIRIAISRKIKDILYATDNTFRLYSMFWKRKIQSFIKEEHISHLHVHDLYMAIPALWATKGSNVQVILDLHENFPYAVEGYAWTKKWPQRLFAFPQKWKKKEKSLLIQSDKIIVLSDTFRDSLIKKYPKLTISKFITYPNVPKPNELPPLQSTINKDNNPFTLFYFGVIAQRRGIYFVLEQMHELVRLHHNINLILIGPVDKAEKQFFNSLINNPLIKKHITYIPWIKVDELPEYSRKAKLALSPLDNNPQHNSGVANKVFQYMSLEIPLLVSNCIPQQKIIEEYNCGWFYEAGNGNSFQKAVIAAKNSPHLRIKGKNGRKAILEKYNTFTAGEELINYYLKEKGNNETT